ncbi:hypothetical protein L207DRAFT_518945 [Hyaloscypha variabilis F]|uniref:Uncharacterized protein n=1 Tax=Hyaloscypha variabilis (strain UAMH 11265 / GT02V1 / F) TaxID=1149755 RepID=A0A2J6R0N3_HYAVF|nr:hypothetical protein L207DRAFT_518945 [Hyaloscypha variabilis F]
MAAPMPIPALAPVERLLDWVAGMGVCGVEELELGVVAEEEDEGEGEDGEIGDVGCEEGESEGDEDEGSDGNKSSQILVKCSAQSILRWLLRVPLLPFSLPFSSPRFSAEAGQRGA